MAVNLAYEIWVGLKHTWSAPDRVDAAESLVSVLIDNDYDAEQIRDVFKSDTDVRRALQSYLDDHEEEDLDEEDEDPYDDEY
jgi:hypothetical protein